MSTLSISYTSHLSSPRRQNALARKERNRKTTKLKLWVMLRLGLIGPGEVTICSSKFSNVQFGHYSDQDDLAEQDCDETNKQNKRRGGRHQQNCWEARDPLPPLSEEVNRPSQGALLSCPQRQFHSQIHKPSSHGCVFSARSWLFASNADICVRYTKPFQLLKSYQHVHARFEQNRSCSTQGIKGDYPETHNRF